MFIFVFALELCFFIYKRAVFCLWREIRKKYQNAYMSFHVRPPEGDIVCFFCCLFVCFSSRERRSSWNISITIPPICLASLTDSLAMVVYLHSSHLCLLKRTAEANVPRYTATVIAAGCTCEDRYADCYRFRLSIHFLLNR